MQLYIGYEGLRVRAYNRVRTDYSNDWVLTILNLQVAARASGSGFQAEISWLLDWQRQVQGLRLLLGASYLDGGL